MKIIVYWIGKTKESFLKEGIEKYLKLLKFYAQIDIVELKDEKEKLPPVLIKEREGRKILEKVKDYALLDENGTQCSSAEFAGFIQSYEGKTLRFLIAGAFGPSDEVRQRASATVSLGKITLTHEMARLILLEQLYRAFTIIRHKPYHY
jgi:23S rRNA (pseudouridine1915-N3)-methyltransferase